MPRSTTKQIRGRKQVDQKDLFDYSVPSKDVVARPVDAYERQYGSSRAKNIEMFMESFKSMSRSVVNAKNIYDTEKESAGYRAGAKGEEPPEGSPAAFMRGYERFKGEGSVSEYHARLNQIFSESADSTPDVYLQKKEALAKEYFNGRTDAFIDGFLPKAMAIEDHMDQKFQQAQKHKLDNDILTQARAKTQADLQLIYSDTVLNQEEKAAAIRQVLTQQQIDAGKLGLSKQQISDNFIESVIETATLSGNPSLLDFAFLKDKSGVALSMNPELSDKIVAGLKRAISAHDANETQALQVRKQALNDASDEIQRGIVDSMQSGDLNTAKGLIGKYKGLLSPDDLQKYYTRLNKLNDESSFAKDTDLWYYRRAYDSALEGKLTDREFDEAMHHMSKSEYMDLIKVNSRGKSSSGSGSNQALLNEYKKMVVDQFTQQDKITGNYKEGSSLDKGNMAKHLFNQYVNKYLSEGNKPKELTPDDLLKWSSTISKLLTGKEQTSEILEGTGLNDDTSGDTNIGDKDFDIDATLKGLK